MDAKKEAGICETNFHASEPRRASICVSKHPHMAGNFLDEVASYLGQWYDVSRNIADGDKGYVYTDADLHIRWTHGAVNDPSRPTISCECGFFPHYDSVQFSDTGCDVRASWWLQRPGFPMGVPHSFDGRKPILVIGQVDHDFVLVNEVNNPGPWKRSIDVLEALKEKTDNLVYRMHPYNMPHQASYEIAMAAKMGVPLDRSPKVDWDNYNMVVAINSTILYEALKNGVPCVSTGLSVATVGNVCVQMGPHNMDDILGGAAHKETSPESGKRFVEWLLTHQYGRHEVGPAMLPLVRRMLGETNDA